MMEPPHENWHRISLVYSTRRTKNIEKKLNQKNVEQSIVCEGSPMDGKSLWWEGLLEKAGKWVLSIEWKGVRDLNGDNGDYRRD